MSRTRHHRRQRKQKCGLDFGAKYKCDKGYCAGSGSIPKDLADSERRNESKKIIREEITNEYPSTAETIHTNNTGI